MRHSCLILFAAFILVMIGVVAAGTPADVGRGAAHSTEYSGYLKLGEAPASRCRFSVELDRILLALNTVQGKYKLIRISFSNESDQPISLSADADKIEMRLGEATIPGSLNLQRDDPTLWDSIDAEIRKKIAYPEIIEPHKSSHESGHLYAWFPADKVTALPSAFTLKIGETPVELKLPLPTAN